MAYQKHNWPALFEKFEESGLSQTEFCKQHELNPKYFSLKLSKRQGFKGTGFAKVNVTPKMSLSPTQGLVLEVGNCKIYCPSAMPIPSFVSLVKSLA